MRPGVRKLAAVLGVCLVFVLGMAAGAAVTVGIVRQRAESLLTRRGSDLATERLARSLAGRLHCDDGQSAQIAEIVRGAHGELWEVRQEAAPRVREILRRAAARIRGILRPDQVGGFDELVTRQSARLHLDEQVSAAPDTTPQAPGH